MKIIINIAICMITITTSSQAQFWGEQKRAIIPWVSFLSPGLGMRTISSETYLSLADNGSLGIRPFNNSFGLGIALTKIKANNFSFYLGYSTDWIIEASKHEDPGTRKLKFSLEFHYLQIDHSDAVFGRLIMAPFPIYVIFVDFSIKAPFNFARLGIAQFGI